MTFETFKIKVENEEHSKAIQVALHELGYRWGNDKLVHATFAPALYPEHNGYIYWSSADCEDGQTLSDPDSHWNKSAKDYPEKFFVDGKFVSEKKSPLTVRPANEIKDMHKAIDMDRFKELHAAMLAHVEQDVQMPTSLYLEYGRVTQEVLRLH